ncbi:MAG: ABC transporter ATP-binding protein [Planctomycetaceae bacterium]|nr:ABC transporter ATP-binding protein [Planctomycetaceae bacterium]
MSAVAVDQVEHRYGDRVALAGVSFTVEERQIFGLLGPNGSGKTTLFRILSTLMPLQKGSVTVCGANVKSAPDDVRRHIGVTFQAPSLDGKLTVYENLKHQGHLYGLSGQTLTQKIEDSMAKLGVADRARDFAEKLSGGLKRRVEIAKCLLHSPKLLLLDEPSTGLDPGARHELWNVLQRLRDEAGVTILVTTHLMEEADKCSMLGILDRGHLVAHGRPDELRSLVGGDCVTIQSDEPSELKAALEEKTGRPVQTVGDSLRIEVESGHELLSEVATSFPGRFRSLTLGKPTLEDVFIKLTGRRMEEADEEAEKPEKKRGRH